jgi:Tsp45I type II restriction enzyme
MGMCLALFRLFFSDPRASRNGELVEMNEWIRRSIEVANGRGYLDRLHEVYPVTREAERELPPEVKAELRAVYDRRDNSALLAVLLKLPKFPIKDPYVAFLRKKEAFLALNPRTVERIVKYLYSMGFERMTEGIEEPKEFNRQIGTLFKRWLPKMGYPVLGEDEFRRHRGIGLLKGSNGELMRFANGALGCDLSKGPDLIAKSGSRHVVGEAKFLTDIGGHQNAQFQDALRLLRGRGGNALRIGILDGVVWIKDGTQMYRTVCQLEQTALSALLLKDLLESLA